MLTLASTTLPYADSFPCQRGTLLTSCLVCFTVWNTVIVFCVQIFSYKCFFWCSGVCCRLNT